MRLRGAVFWTAVLAATCTQVAHTSRSFADDESLTNGLDLVVLVDVSRSMLETIDSRDGNDPQRLRWDAVKLIVDLLTSDDRILIQRFNEAISPKNTFLDGGKRPLSTEDDFPSQFVRLDGEQRSVLSEKIARFNRTGDRNDLLDNGHTKIVEALRTVATNFIAKPALGRETRVLLLTDGLDNDYRDGKYRTDSELRSAIAFYAGENERSKKIPIEVVGLRFPGGDEGLLARQFSNRVATLTGGHFQDVRDGLDLVRIVRDWIWKLKGYWLDTKSYAPDQVSDIKYDTKLVNGIVQLGILSYEVDPRKTNPKERTAPPTHRLRLEWNELKDYPVPKSILRNGTKLADGRVTMYDYFYFGKGDGAEGPHKDSPFAKFKTPVYLTLNGEITDKVQEIHIAKAPQEPLFVLLCPGDNSTFYRQQTLHIRVRMAENWYFQPHQFAVTGELRGQDQDSQPILVPFQIDSTNPRDFVGHISLRTLPRSSDRDYFTLRILVEGIKGSNTALERHSTELPSRTIEVQDHSELKQVKLIELSNEMPYGSVPVDINRPDVPIDYASIDEELTVHADFVPPRAVGAAASLSREHFQLAFIHGADRTMLAGGGNVVLKSGQAQLAVGLNRQNPPPPDVQYEPGKLIISCQDLGIKDSLVVPVYLRLGRERVSIRPAPQQLKAESQPARTEALAVVWDSRLKSKLPPGAVQVALQAVAPSSTAEQVAPFSASELWVQASGPPLDVTQRQQNLSVTIESPFEIYFHPRPDQGQLRPGKHQYKLLVSGDRIDADPIPLYLLIDVPEIVLDNPEATVHVSPGGTGLARFNARLKGVPGQTANIHVAPCVSKSTYTFENTREPAGASCELPIECPTKRNPLVIKATEGAEGTTTIQLKVTVPPRAPLGEYQCDFQLCGDNVADCKLRVHLMVNQLLLETLGVSSSGETLEWQPAGEPRLLQFFHSEMRRTFRVRPGLSTQLTKDMIKVVPVGPFVDSTGDEMPMPTCSTELSADSQSLLVHLNFPVVPNANDRSYYSLTLHAASEILHLDDAHTNVHVRFWPIEDVLEH